MLRFAYPGGRYAAIIEDGVVKSLHVEEPGQLEVSSAEAILRGL